MLVAGLLMSSVILAGCARAIPNAEPTGLATSAQTTEAVVGASVAATPTTFAIIGDYGTGDADESAVAGLVGSWEPDFVITTGDNYYSEAGGKGTDRFERSAGAFYGRWMKDADRPGSPSPEAATNAFFPSIGNHDYTDAKPALGTYLSYFTLPGADFVNTSGNERYYDFVEGPVHFFVLNSNDGEPAGTEGTSKQARWLKQALADSESPWNIVYFHHPPYSSDVEHGSTPRLQWPFAAWGADAVVSGHAHTYERVMRDGIAYFVNGAGGQGRYAFRKSVAGSAVRYGADFGAQKVTATPTELDFGFYNTGGQLIDSWTLTAEPATGK
jgi:hypothetical protein